MKQSTKYLIFFLMDIFLIIAWPTLLLTGTYTMPWMYFIIGVVWYSDIIEAIRHWEQYQMYK